MKPAPIDSSDPRVQAFFNTLLRMAGGEYELQAAVSPQRDLLDAVVHAVNVIVGELNLVRREAQEANQAKSRFLANVSHEIRTPIATILGFVDLLEGHVPSTQTKSVSIIKANGEHLLTLIDQMLDVSAIESGRLSLDPSIVEFVPLAQSLVDGFRVAADKKGIDLSLTFRTCLPRYVEVDADKVKQVVSNVLANAVKFTDEGGVHVTVESPSSSASGQQHLIVQVQDTGPGIPESARTLIFEPFERAEFRGRARQGAGLGLSIARKLAEFMEGSLELVASSGDGSLFRYTQPVVWHDHPHGARFSQAEDHSPMFPGGTKMLVAEDSDDFRSMLRHMLEAAGATVTCVSNGDQALDQARASSYDLIVMDIMMPSVNGLDAARRLRRRGYSGPLVALTALAMPEQLEECRAAGFDLALAKPIVAGEFIPRLIELL